MLILKPKMYLFMCHVLQFWYPLNILIKLILKRIVEGVHAVNECTSVRIDNNYCEYLQLIAKIIALWTSS